MFHSFTQLARIERNGLIPSHNYIKTREGFRARTDVINCLFVENEKYDNTSNCTLTVAISIADKVLDVTNGDLVISVPKTATSCLGIASGLYDVYPIDVDNLLDDFLWVLQTLRCELYYVPFNEVCLNTLDRQLHDEQRKRINYVVVSALYSGVHLHFLPTVLCTSVLTITTNTWYNPYSVDYNVLKSCIRMIKSGDVAYKNAMRHLSLSHVSLDILKEYKIPLCPGTPSLTQLREHSPKKHSKEGTHTFVPSDYSCKKGKVLGNGTYGKVVRSTTGLAVKTMDTFRNIQEMQCYMREVSAMLLLDHENILKIEDVYLNGYSTEEMDGDLFHVREDILMLKRPELTKPEQRSIITQLLSAFEHILSCHVLHRDIKLENILYKDTPNGIRVKVCDFGLSRIYASKSVVEPMTNEVYTVQYRPPELLVNTTHYTWETDIWALMVTIHNLMSRKDLFTSDFITPKDRMEKFCKFYASNVVTILNPKSQLEPLREKCTENLRPGADPIIGDLLMKGMVLNIRPTPTELLKLFD